MIESLTRRQYLPRLREEAHRLLLKNSMTGEKDGKQYRYTVPSLALHFFKNHEQYPFQWFWDSCFHAMVWALFDVERAKDEIRSLLAWQEPNGFIPHVIFWDQKKFRRVLWHWHYWESKGILSCLPRCHKPHASAHIQPAVLVEAIELIWKTDGDIAFLKEVLPRVYRYYRYLADERDPDQDHLISIISQTESGLDYSPAYDAAIGVNNPGPWRLFCAVRWVEGKNKIFFNYNVKRIFRWSNHHIEDVLVNSIYAKGLFVLSDLARVSRETIFVEQTGETLQGWARRQAENTRQALLGKCWDKDAGLFWNLAGKDEQPCKVKTVISLMPLIVPGLPQDVVERLVNHLVNPDEFWTPYPIASVARGEPTFCSDNRIPGHYLKRWKRFRYRFLWRGAVFNNEKHFLIQGLRHYGYAGLAETLATTWMRNTYYRGFNEANDALTGLPVDTPQFGWATLVVIQ